MADIIPCQFCGQEATVHLTQIIQNQVHKVDLCEECARQKGVTEVEGFSLADLLAKSHLVGAAGGVRGLTCEACGFSPADFKRLGRLGCPRCYGQFKGILEPMLGGMHRGVEHRGKVPEVALRRGEAQARGERLRQALAEAVRDERYEEAAAIRDELRRLGSPDEPAQASPGKGR